MATNPLQSVLDVFVNELGTITIREGDSTAEVESMVVVHPDDVSRLMRDLDRARRVAIQASANEQEDVRDLELYARWRSGSA
jgi:hypothetical protein